MEVKQPVQVALKDNGIQCLDENFARLTLYITDSRNLGGYAVEDVKVTNKVSGLKVVHTFYCAFPTQFFTRNDPKLKRVLQFMAKIVQSHPESGVWCEAHSRIFASKRKKEIKSLVRFLNAKPRSNRIAPR